MSTGNKTTITKDIDNRSLTVTRAFNADVDKVWRAWTEKEWLDQWWAPRPYKAETKTLEFREGGMWLYAMVGPDGSKSWCRVDFISIITPDSYAADTSFCDEDGNLTNQIPVMHWNCSFSAEGGATNVTVIVSFDNPGDLEKIVEMGFEEGFTAAHGNLDELLAK